MRATRPRITNSLGPGHQRFVPPLDQSIAPFEGYPCLQASGWVQYSTTMARRLEGLSSAGRAGVTVVRISQSPART